jgi:hypothetical protein
MKKESSFEWPDNYNVQLKSPSGWCLTEYHKKCPHQFTHGKCGCICHKEKK